VVSPSQSTSGVIIGLPYGLHIRRTGHAPLRGPSAGRWVLTTSNAAGTNGLTCLPKHGGARDNKFMVIHPMTNQRCLTSAIVRWSAPTAWPSSSSGLSAVNPLVVFYDTSISEMSLQPLGGYSVSGMYVCTVKSTSDYTLRTLYRSYRRISSNYELQVI
jgi:hypothetical protein